MNMSACCKVVLAKAAETAATGDVTSDAIDTAGFEGCMFVGSIGTANAGNYAKAQQSGDSGGSPDGYSDLEGSKNVATPSGDSFVLDIYRPQKRYLKCIVVRGASTISGDVYAILYGARHVPVTQGTTIDAETHASPAEGTA